MTREELLHILWEEDFTLITEPNGDVRSRIRLNNKTYESNIKMREEDIPRDKTGIVWEELFFENKKFRKVLEDLLEQINKPMEHPKQTTTIRLDYSKEQDYVYYDKHGQEITVGMILKHDDGDLENVIEGENSLGFLATKKEWLNISRPEVYPLSEFDLNEWEIIYEEDNNVS